MIDLHYWPTPNGHKVTMFLEEAGLPYQIMPVNIGKGEQFKPEFLAISPNNRMPAIVDHEPAGGGAPVSRVRIRRDPALSRREDRALHPAGPARTRPRRCSGCSGRWAASGRWPGQNHHFTQLRAREDALRDRPLRQRDEPALRRARQAARRPRSWPARLLDRRHGVPIRGSCRTSARARTSTTSRTSSAGSSDPRAGRRRSAPTRRRTRSTRRRGGVRMAEERARSCSGRPRLACGGAERRLLGGRARTVYTRSTN